MYYNKIIQIKGLDIKNFLIILCSLFFLIGCANKQPKLTSSATILIKTPKLKFYDKGFISKFDDYVEVQILSAGTSVLKLKIYNSMICRDTFECQTLKSFNAEYLSEDYEDKFIKNLFDKDDKQIVFRDKKNHILIKIKKD